MSSQPLFSIIIPSYNTLNLLKRCLKSITEQSFRDFEVWIIDGDSTDGTKKFLNEISIPFYSISEKDKGIYHAMNKGIDCAKGKWLYFLGADDLLAGNSVLKRISENESVDYQLILGKIKHDTVIEHTNSTMGLESALSRQLWIKNTIHHQGAFYHRDIFKSQRYDESYKVLADYKLNLELLKKSINFLNTDIVIAYCGNQGISKKFNWDLYKEEIRLKTETSSLIYKPFFWILGVCKFFLKGRNKSLL